MTALLYYSIASGLTKNEIIEIDCQVTKNREFVRNGPSNLKRKTKRVFLYATFIFQLGQPLGPYAAAVMMPLPPQISIEHLVSAEVLRSNNQCLNIKAKMDKMTLTDQQIEDLSLICYKLQTGSITIDKTILELRAGGFYDWATLAFIIYMFSLQQGNSFQNVPLPHQDPFGWLNGKYDSRNVSNNQCLSDPLSMFKRQTLHAVKQMCDASADENGFVMTYEDAYNLVKETYPGYLKVNESCHITDWQAAKHIYHLNGMGINPVDYGFTQQELERIRGEAGYKGGGLIAYARRGYRLPPIEMVRDYQGRLKLTCDQSPIKRTSVPYYDKNGAWEATIFATPPSEDYSGIIIAFNESTGDLITGDKQRKSAFDRFEKQNYIGGKKWMLKWNN
uniref:hypothetical protein n=1 Tax=Nitzschia traheaformis TaxID=1881117 RepID=UPI001EF9D377|nr:hypothetical protein MKU15_pgp062 [Nitzschia traheaformis]ULD15893.1 hypothetical protein [Nitzschia traheaformis]